MAPASGLKPMEELAVLFQEQVLKIYGDLSFIPFSMSLIALVNFNIMEKMLKIAQEKDININKSSIESYLMFEDLFKVLKIIHTRITQIEQMLSNIPAIKKANRRYRVLFIFL